MGSIPKIVSTPLKWVSKQFINRTLLRFPGGDAHDPIACTYCPEMCRFACPSAVVSANDAVTPCNKMSLLHKEERWPGRAGGGGPLWSLYDCTGCGRCTTHCVYGVPVAEQLFEARLTHGWDRAKEVASRVTDAEDLYGDLADELGDAANAKRRLKAYGAPEFDEPKAVHFARANDVKDARLSWERALDAQAGSPETQAYQKKVLDGLKREMGSRIWLIHESSWLTRRLEREDAVAAWVTRAQVAGLSLVWAYHRGKDCIDAGGEGAYSRLFPEQAALMAREFWERDRHRAEGIFCFSERDAEHFRHAVPGIPVVSLVAAARKAKA